MKKVYAVSAGSYSDYHIVGVFSTKKKANTVNHKYFLSRNPIEEWTIDKLPKTPKGLMPYYIIMTWEGDVKKAERVSVDDYSGDFAARTYWTSHTNSDGFCDLEVQCWAKDDKHAIKIASEKRAQKIAYNEWKKRDPAEKDEEDDETSETSSTSVDE